MRSLLPLSLLALAAPVAAQTSSNTSESDHGTFVLHKFAKPIGKETWQIRAEDGGHIVLTSNFLFNDRGMDVPLKTTYTASASREPLSLRLTGRSSRISTLNDTLTLGAGAVTLLRDGKATSYPADASTFLIDGYSPVAMQGELVRWWLAHGRPARINTPPGGTVRIQPAGELTVGRATFHGYVVDGLIWGGETLWMDDAQQLVALVSTDAEFDHFEAVRDDLEPSLGTFIRAAANNNLVALNQLAATAKQAAVRRLAIVGVTLIDGTGAAAVANSTVLVENGRIASVFQGSLPKLKNVTVLDGHGKYLIPGLWDMHAH